MLKKKNKANTPLFKVIIKKGFNYFSQNISLKIIKIEDIESKFAVSVSKKEVKTAVKRNLVKRRVLSILRRVKPKINDGFGCAFFLKKGALNLSYQALQSEVVFLLKKAKVLSSLPTTYNLPPTT